MNTFTQIGIIVVALMHLLFMYIEIFRWENPKTVKAFALKSIDFARETKVLAANQGLYNGFISAGLIFSLVRGDAAFAAFFLGCVAVAGLFAWYTTGERKLFLIQSSPAILSLFSMLI